ncbi:DUF268 domain-containing protein [Alphaproteobacteria bacterium]|nr:DUF268 domain-containing protein [Alphaproteobacteria bacterium]
MFLRKIIRFLKAYITGWANFCYTYIAYKKLCKRNQIAIDIGIFPRVLDKTFETSYDGHYVYHTSWAARCLKKINPKVHYDISSSLFFCGIVSSFIPIKFFDYRPARLSLSDLSSEFGDLLSLSLGDNSLESISCMHVIEHIGLGRYGDELDVVAYAKAINELKRVTKIGGSILFVVPIGKEKTYFNAHRVFSLDTILENFVGFELIDFSMLPDDYHDSGLISFPSAALVEKQRYACGMFWFKKNAVSN